MYTYLNSLKIPRILLGTSPFIAGGQFGLRAWEYYRKFVGKSDEVTKIMEYCIELGVRGIQVLSYDYIVEAVKRATERTGINLFVIGTLMPEDPEESLALLTNIGCKVALVHGALAIPRYLKKIGEYLELIEGAGLVPGIALHDISALNVILKEYPQIKVVMAPINVKGIFMGDREESLKILEESKHFIIAKKVLGAGRIKPENALKYVFSLPFVKAVAVGVASKREAEETFTIAFKVLKEARGGISRDLSGIE